MCDLLEFLTINHHTEGKEEGLAGTPFAMHDEDRITPGLSQELNRSHCLHELLHPY